MRCPLLIGSLVCLVSFYHVCLAGQPVAEAGETFYLVARAYAGDTLVQSSALLYLNQADGTCVALSGTQAVPEGAAGTFMPAMVLAARPPATDDAAIAGALEEALQGAVCPPLEQAVFAGHRLLYYFPDATRVEFTLMRVTDSSSIPDSAGEPEGELVAELVVIN